MKAASSKVEVRVTGTSPLSFMLSPGRVLSIKRIEPSASNRPTVGGKFKKNAYLIYNGVTKVGRLSDAAVKKISFAVPEACTVVTVDKENEILVVAIGG